MKIRLLGETELVVSELHDEHLTVTGDEAGLRFGAMEMFVTSLAACTYAVLASYAHQIDAGVADLHIRLRWHYKDRPYRIDTVEMEIRWPELPEDRVDAAVRAASTCTLHRTLERGVEVGTTVVR
ncbi:MAG: hypothetical protein B7Z66_06735 [Chromatiales bacterium 21-64-14]|nr:MAG: hypothetical protein B7Z66_06735 [Chromatiales bacterium 21-64-14]HQU16679.1 OsmC family protein [Gammaproteobacteria bacterium]